jgi:hypothetical protein
MIEITFKTSCIMCGFSTRHASLAAGQSVKFKCPRCNATTTLDNINGRIKQSYFQFENDINDRNKIPSHSKWLT